MAGTQTGTPTLDSGLFINRGGSQTQSFIWDESNDEFALASTNDSSTVIGNVNISGYSDLKLNKITGSQGDLSFINSYIGTFSEINTNYIDFGTTSVPATQSGRLYFDNAEASLSYYPDSNQDVVVRIGQQLYLRVNNVSGSDISKGSVVRIVSASGGLPNVTLANANHTSSPNNRVVGLAADVIPNGGVGLVLVNGLLTGLNLSSYSVGDLLYLSDVTSGGYKLASNLGITAITNEIGYVIDNSSTNGRIYVNVNNEDRNLTLTDIERNILEGNVISTGLYEYSPGLTRISGTTFSISAAKGWIAKNTYTYSVLPDVVNIQFAGATGLSTPYLNSDSSTYVLLSSTASVILQPTFPTPQQRRESIYLGKIVHSDKTSILNVNNTPDFDVSPMSAIRDLWTPIKMINQGVTINNNGSNLGFRVSGGYLWGNGVGWVTNQLDPDRVAIAGQIPATFQYRTQLGGTYSNTNVLDCDYWDNAGVRTNISGGGGQSTNQRVYLFPTGLIRVQYGQKVYGNLTDAATGLSSETFVEYTNNADNAILIGIISVRSDASNLSNTSQALFHPVSKFGELLGGAPGGVSTTSLQGAYDNSSSNPEILTNSTLGGVNIRRGSALDTDNVLAIQNGTGTDVVTIAGDGHLTTQTLTISALTATSSSLNYVVVDGSGNTYYQTVFAGTSGTSGTTGTSGTSATSGTSGTSATSGTSGTGFNTISSPADYRILTSTGSSTNSAVAQSSLTFNPNTGVLGLTGSFTISGTPSGGDVLTVYGSAGQLFAINDSLTGSLFSVNDISGLPILEVFSDNTTIIGDYVAPSLYTTKKTTVGTSSTDIYSFATASYDGAFVDYVIKNGSNSRSGSLIANWNGSSIKYTDNSTLDIGTTSGFTFSFAISGTYGVLRGQASTTGWTVKTIIRSI